MMQQQKLEKNICTKLFIVSVLVKVKIWKQPTYLPIVDRSNKLWYIHTFGSREI